MLCMISITTHEYLLTEHLAERLSALVFPVLNSLLRRRQPVPEGQHSAEPRGGITCLLFQDRRIARCQLASSLQVLDGILVLLDGDFAQRTAVERFRLFSVSQLPLHLL